MATKDKLGDRIKEYYENASKTRLLKKTPVCIRIDGKAHHTYTKFLKKPFDKFYRDAMSETMQYLCQNIQGCVFGYTQSDEISLILIDYQNRDTSAWFDYEVQKMCAIAASMATMAFNKFFKDNVEAHNCLFLEDVKDAEELMYFNRLSQTADAQCAMFDARCFSIPKEEVANTIYWRQMDAIKNSVQMVGRCYFSDKELKNKNTKDIKEMLMAQKDVDWKSYPLEYQRGCACIKKEFVKAGDGQQTKDAIRRKWVIDKEMPIIKGEDREYVEKHILI